MLSDLVHGQHRRENRAVEAAAPFGRDAVRAARTVPIGAGHDDDRVELLGEEVAGGREVRGVRVIAHDRVRVEFLGDELDLRAPGAADHDTMAGGPEALRHRAAQLPVGAGDQDVHQPPPGTHSTAGERVLNTSPRARPRVPADRRT